MIGRNEGRRLGGCFESIQSVGCRMVYVDSDSTDDSVGIATSKGIPVVKLSGDRPLSAARGRNAGFSWLLDKFPDLRYVQFVDGDCELRRSWIGAGHAFLERNPRVGIVCGELAERSTDSSMFHRLAQMEWSREPGVIATCGGIFLIRTELFSELGGFREDVPAGEEPEMCIRVRELGWRIERIGDAMAVHDAGVVSLRQWWIRASRGGHAAAQIACIHPCGEDGGYRRRLRSIVIWGALLPGAFLFSVLVAIQWPWFAALAVAVLALYGLLLTRIWIKRFQRSGSRFDSGVYALFCVFAKWAEFAGAVRYWIRRGLGRELTWIEYKSPVS